MVFVSGLSKRFNMQDANQSLIVDMDLGVAVDYVDSVRRIKIRLSAGQSCLQNEGR